ncbi:hypothetical protein EV363DRAFT_1306183 [Boletus edulis]|nr:hypothetical protein EV363DRAFT_1464416 [Boletus edulis]KAF8119266.1 hypothetical protein EV363DRAFT_1306183 [Boletus edulis]
MNASHEIQNEVLLYTGRVQVALQTVPTIVGPKEDWGPWMRDHLASGQSELPKPTANSPHPRLLGSLKAMLGRHYRSGMTLDTLSFDQVRADDPAITGSEYVEVPASSVPRPNGDDNWWLLLPPSASFKAESTEGSSAPVPSASGLEVSRPPSAAGETAGSKEDDVPMADSNLSDAGNAGDTGTRVDRKGKKRAQIDDVIHISSPATKRPKNSINVDEGNDSQAGPSQTPEAMKAEEQPEASTSASKVCDACKARGSECVWGTVNKKRACLPCTSAKTRCKVEGLPDIRRPRGKGSRSVGVGEKMEILATIKERVARLEKTVEEREEEKQKMVTRISELEEEVKRLKKKKGPHDRP